jgi:hypothetical protein
MSGSHFGDDDAWASARDATRADVRAALAPRQGRRCPSCGHEELGPGRTCSNCGSELVVRSARRGPSRRASVAIGAVLVALAATAAVVVPALREDADAERRAAERDRAAAIEREQARLRRDSRPFEARGPRRREGEAPLEHRARLVTAGEATITADARERVRAGSVDGPILGTRCAPYPKTETRSAQEADPALPRNRYECIAFNREVEVPELEGRKRTAVLGVPYWMVVDYRSARMTFCKVTPKPGEGGRALTSVPVPRPCRDPLR